MTTRVADDGTIEVRVVLFVRVDPQAWALDMMGEHPDEVLHKEVRADVKQYAARLIEESGMKESTYRPDETSVPILDVIIDPKRS